MAGARIRLKITIIDRMSGVRVAAKTANRRFLFKAASFVMKAARSSIKGRTKIKRKGASKAGTPPHTGPGKLLKRSIKFDVDGFARDAVIGPRASFVGPSGGAHEHGGKYKRERYPKRQFMWPALKKSRPYFDSIWSGILKKSIRR